MSLSKKYLYLAYGSNTNIDQMRYRCPTAKPLYPLMIYNRILHFAKTATVLTSNHPKAVLYGAVYELDHYDLLSLNWYEGIRRNIYQRTTIEVNFEGEFRSYIIYLKSRNNARFPKDDYIRTIIKGYKDWGLPQDRIRLALERCERSVQQRQQRIQTKTQEHQTVIFDGRKA